jgi:hypothetical protein
MYDPQNARMLSADPILQDATSSQAYNKYSYCINNPLKYTDPSGYVFIKGKNNDWVIDYPGSKSTGQSWRDDPTVVKGSNGMPIGANGKEYSSFGDFGFNIDDGDNDYVNSKLPGLSTFLIQGYDHQGKYSSFTTTDKKLARIYNGPNFIDKVPNPWFMADVTEISNEAQSNGAGGALNNIANSLGIAMGVQQESLGYAVAQNYKSARNPWDFASLRKTQQTGRVTNTLGKVGNGLLTTTKALGVVAGVAQVGIKGFEIYEKGVENATVRDWSDIGVNTAGVVAAVFFASNPIGWAVGAAALGYSIATTIYDANTKP